MSDAWLRGLRGDNALTTPRSARGATSRRTSDDGSAPTSDGGADTAASKRVPAPPMSARGGATKAAPITPQTALKPPLPAAAKVTPRLSRVPTLNLAPRTTADASDDDESPRSRVPSVSGDGSHTDEVMMEGDSVQVFVRVRPSNETEIEATGVTQELPCMRISGENTVVASIPGRNPKHYTYDKVLLETASQVDVFEAAGVPMVDNCMSGYNSSIFVYGQTGAGKTHTMMGDLSINTDMRSDQRGLAPRMIELLFDRISSAEDAAGRDALRYSCRCSCLEIYNETISDLLNQASVNMQIREDAGRGAYVDGISEKEVLNVDDVMALMWKGNKNRHVGETNMNARSSRSHCVFTCVVERTSKNRETGVTSVVGSRLNLIDLAGSERIKGGALGGSKVDGEHFKEAVHINQSLTTLGRVIMELVEAQKAGRNNHSHGHHIPYRDSKLTFLLQDSLGGNAKTMIIANVSPSPVCAAETVSTLKFVARAKCIRNKATINLDYRGDVALLQKEIVRLNVELDHLRKGFTDPAIQENKDLRQRLKTAEKQRDEDELRLQGLTNENVRFKKETERMKARLLEVDEGSQGLAKVAESLQLRVAQAEAGGSEAAQAAAKVRDALVDEVAAWKRRSEALAWQLQQVQASSAEQQSAALQAREQLQNQLATSSKLIQALERETTTLKSQAEEAEEAKAALAALYAEAREGLEAEKNRSCEAQAQAASLQEVVASLEGVVAELTAKCEAQGSSAQREQQALQQESEARLAALAARLEEAQKAAAQQAADMAAMHEAGIAQAQELAAVQEQLGKEQQAHARSKAALSEHAAEQESALRGELEEQAREQQSLRLRLAESELLVASTQDTVAGLRAELAGLQASLADESEALAAETAALALSRAQAGEAGVRVKALEAALETETAALAQSRAQAEEAGERVKALEAALEAETAALAQLRVQATALNEQIEASAVALAAETAALAQSRDQASERAERVQASEAALAAAEGKLAAAEQQLSELRRVIEDKEADIQVQRAVSCSEADRLGAEQLALQGLVEELRAANEVAAVLSAQQREQLDLMGKEAQQAAERHAGEMGKMQWEQAKLSEEVLGLKQEAQRAAERHAGEVAEMKGEQARMSQVIEGLKQEAQQAAERHAGEVAQMQDEQAKMSEAIEGVRRAAGAEAEGHAGEVAQLQQQQARLHEEVQGLKQTADRTAGEHAEEVAVLRQEQARLSETLQGLTQERDRLQTGLEAKVAEVEGLRGDVEASKRALGEAQQLVQATSGDAQATKAKLTTTLQQLQRCEGQLAEQEELVRSLQREVIGTQEQLAARSFELGLQTAAAEKLRAEHASVHQQLDAKNAELASVHATLAHRMQELAEAQHELRQTYEGKSDMENQMKGFLVTTTRQTRAFQEIRRLINWATTPPSSVTSSLAHHDSSTPTALMGADDMLQSPVVSPDQAGEEQRSKGDQQACMAQEVDQPRGQGAKQAGAALARLSLQFDGAADGAGEQGQGRMGQSPGGSVRSKHVDQARRQESEDDVLSPAAAASGKDQIK